MATIEFWISIREIGNLFLGAEFRVQLASPKVCWWEARHTKDYMKSHWAKVRIDTTMYKLIDSDHGHGILTFAPLYPTKANG